MPNFLLRVLLEGGSYLLIFCVIAGLIRMRALFEGGSLLRIYGRLLISLMTGAPHPLSKFRFSFAKCFFKFLNSEYQFRNTVNPKKKKQLYNSYCMD